MGVDYHAYAVIGIPIDAIPTSQKTRKIGKHDFPETIKFHPETGKRLWSVDEEPDFSFDPDEENENTIALPDGIQAYYTTDKNECVLGFGVETPYNGELGFSEVPDVSEIKETLRKLLEPLKLWKPKKFGLYTVLHCSY